MASGQVGRLSVRVLPDTTRFKEDLRKALTRIEKTAKAAVQVRPELDKSSLANVKRQLSDLDATVRVAADLAAGAKERIEDKLDDLDAEATVNADADTAAARAKIAAAARPRFVPIHLTVAKSSLAKVGAAIATMSGAKNLQRLASNISDVLSNASSIVPAMARASTAIGALGSISLVGAGNILSIGSSFNAIFPAALALPGILAGFGVGAGVMIAALKDMGTVLADLGPRFSALQDTISSNFWEKAEGPIRNLATTWLPSLSRGFGEIATQLGIWAGSLSNALSSADNLGHLNSILDAVRDSIDIAGEGIAHFADAMMGLIDVGASYLPHLASWFNRISESFSGWVETNTANGKMFEWIDAGVQGLKDLGRVLSGAWGVMGGFAKAAKEAGGATLGSLADGLHSLSDTVNSPSFQDGLVGTFRAARDAMDNMAPGFDAIGSGIGSILPTIQDAMRLSGDIAGTMMTGFGEAMKSPALQGGIEAFFKGVLAAAEALAPVMPVVADVLGRALDAGGKLAETIGNVLSAAVENFGPALGDVLDIAGDLIPVLGDWLVGAIEAVGPVIGDVIGAISDWVAENPEFAATIGIVAGAIGGLIAAAAPVVSALLPVIASVVTFVSSAGGVAAVGGAISAAAGAIAAVAGPVALVVGILAAVAGALIYAWNESDTFRQKVGELFQAIKDFAQPVLDFITDTVIPVLEQVFESVKQAFETIMDSLVPMIEKVVEIITVIFEKLTPFVEFIMGVLGPVFQFLGDVVSAAFEFIGEVIARVIDTITAILDVFLNILRGDWPAVWESVKGVVSAVWELIKTIIGGALEFIWAIIQAGLDLIVGIWEAIWASIGDFLVGVWEGIKGVVSGFWDWLTEVFTAAVEWVGGLWQSIWNPITEFFSGIWDGIKGVAQGFWDWVSETWSAAVDTVSGLWQSIWNPIVEFFSPIWDGIKDVVKGAMDYISEIIELVGGIIREFWTGVWEGIADFIRPIWDKIKSVVSTAIQVVSDKIRSVLDRIKSIWGSIWDWVSSKARAIWDTVKSVISTAIQVVSDKIRSVLDRIKSIWDSAWGAISDKVKSIWDSIKSAISSAVQSVSDKIRGTLDTIKGLWQSGWDRVKSILTGAWDTMISAVGGKISDLIAKVKEIPGKIKSALSRLKSDARGMGRDMIQGMINGIKSMASSLVNSAKGVVGDAVQGAKNLLGIHSPSRVFEQIGRFTVQGLEQGLDKNAGLATRASEALARGVTKGYEDGASALSALTAPVTLTPSHRGLPDLGGVGGEFGAASIDDVVAALYQLLAAVNAKDLAVTISDREFAGLVRRAGRTLSR